jgi:phosphoribosylformimino-5-aminoimidazole carboxamide ribotide isomerase
VPASRQSTFDLYPAIDLRDGRVVRLRQGDFGREEVYDDDPVAVARRFVAQGVSWIHVVDLDGARAGERRQAGTVSSIVAVAQGTSTRVQVAGGLRTQGAVAEVLASGVHRAVISTAALQDPDFVEQAIERQGPNAIAVALDVRDGLAVGDGWVPGAAGAPFLQSLDSLADVGVTTFAVTAIARDGLLGGPDLELLESCLRATDAAIIASGGIRSIEDLEAVRDIGCSGAIVGRAIYDGSLDLALAMSITGASSASRATELS